MKIYQGTILTCDDGDSVARYLVECDGRIDFVVDEPSARYDGVPIDIRVEGLVLSGKPYREQSQSVLRAVAAGIVGKGRI